MPIFGGLNRADGLKEEGREMEIPDNQEMPMPLTSKELIVIMRCLKAALNWNRLTEEEKEIIRKMTVRIGRYAERQGAYWDK
jgi:hypothetical protein